MSNNNGNGHAMPQNSTGSIDAYQALPSLTTAALSGVGGIFLPSKEEQTKSMQMQLDAKIPRDAIETRDSGFGKPLSYLSGWYVIDRLNQIFGQGNWDYQLLELTKTFEGEVNGKNYVSYLAKVHMRATFPNNTDAYFTDIGFGDGQDAKNPGKAHELATKEAVTDGLKRCAKSLGMSMGLALYDKSQENVEDEQKTVQKMVAPVSNAAKSPVPTANGTSTNKQTSGANTAESKVAGNAAPASSISTRDILTATIKALAAQGKIIITEYKFNRKEKYGVELVKDLTDTQVQEEIDNLNKRFNLGGK